MRTTLTVLAVIIIALIAVWAIDIDFSGETEMPTADVQVEGGNLPDADVDTADVDVQTEEQTVTVPDVDVTTEEQTVPTPDVTVTEPEADTTQQQ